MCSVWGSELLTSRPRSGPLFSKFVFGCDCCTLLAAGRMGWSCCCVALLNEHLFAIKVLKSAVKISVAGSVFGALFGALCASPVAYTNVRVTKGNVSCAWSASLATAHNVSRASLSVLCACASSGEGLIHSSLTRLAGILLLSSASIFICRRRMCREARQMGLAAKSSVRSRSFVLVQSRCDCRMQREDWRSGLRERSSCV
ncbi:hypothetical protein EXIGLDRAFT_151777 [Exidia glandulosa HHB12029]|uniref:Uncharacterized protein n=1 Tax=Exidia glandulosa HHB12029 TaxID=1314781 RepID=A0A165QDE0_EXIGL|nr:hypothetical protein EXIGLDRAFT_151777 [Exidia glandulosa HHB12029]